MKPKFLAAFLVVLASEVVAADLDVHITGANPDFFVPAGCTNFFSCVVTNAGPVDRKLEFTVRLLQFPEEFVVHEQKRTVTLNTGATTIPLTFPLSEPNVYRAEINFTENGVPAGGKRWLFCHDFARWEPRAKRPSDFDAFWERTLAELAKVPVDLRRTLAAEDERGSLYKIDYAVLNGERGYGWLRIPKHKPGEKLHARLCLPGSGFGKQPQALATRGVEMMLTIHNVPVDLDAGEYGAQFHRTFYATWGLESKETYYYRNVFARCVRAVDVLASLPEVDSSRLLVTGTSQGGALAIVTAALNPKAALCGPGYPGLCRLDWTVAHKAGTWPFQGAPAGLPLDQVLDTFSYYDVANFIGRVRCPIVAMFAWSDTHTAGGGQIAAFAQANKSNLTLFAGPWATHAGGDMRSQRLWGERMESFLRGEPVTHVRTWEQIETKQPIRP